MTISTPPWSTGWLFHSSSRREPDAHPLHLLESPLPTGHPRAAFGECRQQSPIDLSGGPVPGIGGLTVIALGVLVTIVSPQLWWLVGAGGVAGLLLGGVLVIAHGREGLGVSTDRRSRLLLNGR